MRCIKDKTFETKIEINDSFENTIFWNCVFKDDIEIVDIHSKRIIRFYGCQIEKSCFVKTLDKNVSPIEIDISFSFSEIKFLQIGDKSLHEYNWTIDICDTEIDYCNIRNCVCDKININKSEIDDLLLNFCIGNVFNDPEINIDDSRIKTFWANHISNIYELNITNSRFNLLNIYDSSFNAGIKIYKTVNEGETNIDLYKSGNFIIQDSNFEKKFRCSYIKPYDEKESVGKIQLAEDVFQEKAEFSGTQIDRIDISCSAAKMEGEISFVGFKVLDTLTLSGFNKHADFQFLHLNVCLFSCRNFLNYGSVSILGLTCYKGKNPGFLIAGPSNIGNMNIQGSDLSSFPLISFLDCSLFGLKYSNVKWFDPKILNQNNSKAPDFWERKQEAYRQLKYCAEDNKDKIQALIFKAYEIDAYQHTLSWKRNFSDLLMLWLNKISNNHGLSWNRGLFFTIFCGLLFYLIFYGCYDDLSYRMYFWGNFIKYIWLFNGIDDLIQFLNQPLNSFGDCLIRFLGSICYIIGKILVAYGIFQTISAFRKYVKID